MAALLRVLLVDDDEISLRVIAKALATRFSVLSANSGSSAVSVLEREAVDAVIADQQMPGMTGAELLDLAHRLRPAAARILVTASQRIDVLGEAVNRARVHRFLTKPLHLPELPALLESAIREASLEAENARLVAELAHLNAALEAEVAERTRELKQAVEKLENLALRDGLTGLYNHRFLQQAIDVELSRARRHGHELGLLFIDVDHFKLYNDRNGHPAGDRVLERIAQILTGGGQSGLPVRVRASDIVARYGGEEFAMVLPETGVSGSSIKAEHVRQAISSYAFEHGQLQPAGHISVSIGVAVFPLHAKEKPELLDLADHEMYRAKALGRDRVCVHERP